MRKKISLLLILSAVLFLSSCLDSGDRSYIGTLEFSYITQGQTTGIVYARTAAGYLITSPKIKQLSPGTIARISYQVKTDEDESVIVDDNVSAYVVELGAEPEIIDQTILHFSSAPDVPAVNFESFLEPIFIENDYFGDRWTFPYTVKMKKGEFARVSFYKETEEAPNQTLGHEIVIDVRFEKMGTPESGAADKIEGNYIAVDMSALRLLLVDKTDTNGNVYLKFRYYRSDIEGLYTSNKAYMMHIGKE